jgi:hypothetical protein
LLLVLHGDPLVPDSHEIGSSNPEVHMRCSPRIVGTFGLAVCLAAALTARGDCQAPPAGKPVVIPENATALEGRPTIRIDATQAGATQRKLEGAEAARQSLKVSIVDGRFYWTSRENILLTLIPSGQYTYLSSEPGKYIRLRKIDDKLEYVEHVDTDAVSVTFWGELRIVLKK